MKKDKDTSSRKGGLDLVRVRRAGHITQSRKVRESMNLGEGDYLEPRFTEGGILLQPVSVRSREPSAAQEAEILDVVNQERRKYANERRH
jgi:hypothetical protein